MLISSVFIFLFLLACNFKNFDYKNSIKVSKSIKESKENKVYIYRYKIENITTYNKLYKFPIIDVWLERRYHLELNNLNKEVIIIDEKEPYNIVFSLNEKDSTLTSNNNIDGKWIIWLENKIKPNSNINDMLFVPINSSQINDTLDFTIYKQSTPNDFKKNIEKLISFSISKIYNE